MNLNGDVPSESVAASSTLDAIANVDLDEGSNDHRSLLNARLGASAQLSNPESPQAVRAREESQGARRRTPISLGNRLVPAMPQNPEYSDPDGQDDRNFDRIQHPLPEAQSLRLNSEESRYSEARERNQVQAQSLNSNTSSGSTILSGSIGSSTNTQSLPPPSGVPTSPPPPTLNDQIFSFTRNTPAEPVQIDRIPEVKTYSLQELGIYHERVKFQALAIAAAREATFETWPKDKNFFSIVKAVEAGLFYMGYGDATRCFHCGGRLNKWRREDNPFVEHTRLYPRCPYIRQKMGQQFVEAVINRQNSGERLISYREVAQELAQRGILVGEDLERSLLQDAAVKAMMDLHFSETEVLDVAKRLYNDGKTLSSSELYKELCTTKDPASSEEDSSISKEEQEDIRKLNSKNQDIRREMLCKVCMERNVKMIFLPCGHLATCQECALAMAECPMCRSVIRASVIANFQG